MDISDWKIIDLHRKANDKNTWYFTIIKPDGKRHYTRDIGFGKTWTCKTAIGGDIYVVDRYQSTFNLYVKAATEAGAIRKISRYVVVLAKDWNLREKIKAEPVKEITFNKRAVPKVIGVEKQLEAPKADKVRQWNW